MHPLLAYRTKHHLTLDALAEMSGISRTTLWRIEKGRVCATGHTASSLIKASKGKLKAEDFLPRQQEE